MTEIVLLGVIAGLAINNFVLYLSWKKTKDLAAAWESEARQLLAVVQRFYECPVNSQ